MSERRLVTFLYWWTLVFGSASGGAAIASVGMSQWGFAAFYILCFGIHMKLLSSAIEWREGVR